MKLINLVDNKIKSITIQDFYNNFIKHNVKSNHFDSLEILIAWLPNIIKIEFNYKTSNPYMVVYLNDIRGSHVEFECTGIEWMLEDYVNGINYN